MPSTTSSSVSRLFASSTVITPSLPTFCMALAIMSPMSFSPLAEIVPTCAISSVPLTFLERLVMSLIASATARSTPRFTSIGFMPAATALAPSLTIAWASTQAVVVPSPATSLVLEATSRTIWAPMFSNLSDSSISFATVTPSLVMRGAPKDFSITTLRPFGPSVTFTASARMSTPRSIFSRAFAENFTSLAAIGYMPPVLIRLRWNGLRGLLGGGGLFDDAHDVGLLHDEEILAVDAHLGAGPLAEQHPVPGLDVEGLDLPALVARAGPDRDDLALLGLLLGGIGNDDAALGLLFRVNAADDDAIMEWAEFHDDPPGDNVKIFLSHPRKALALTCE